MRYKNFEGASAKQVEAVMLIVPGPEGEGLTYEKASKELGINESAFIKRIDGFKNRCPEAWDEIQSMWRVASRQRESLENPISLEDVDMDIAIDENRIKDIF